MSLTEKKEKLLYLIEDADEKLTGLLIALAGEYNDADQDYSKEEAHNIVRRNYKHG